MQQTRGGITGGAAGVQAVAPKAAHCSAQRWVLLEAVQLLRHRVRDHHERLLAGRQAAAEQSLPGESLRTELVKLSCSAPVIICATMTCSSLHFRP